MSSELISVSKGDVLSEGRVSLQGEEALQVGLGWLGGGLRLGARACGAEWALRVGFGWRGGSL